MTMSAVPSTSTKGGRSHAEPTADGKTASHAAARHGRGSEGAGARSSDQRTEFPRTTLPADRSAMSKDMGIDDESSHPRLCPEVADGVTRLMGVRLFREPDAVTPPVRFDEREQETEPGQTGLRRVKRKPSPTATGRLTPLRLFSTLPHYLPGEFKSV